jgi:uracil-DNA glycosylase
LIWNAVPWYLGTSGKLAAVRAADVAAGSAWLLEFLDLLPELAVVITLGGTARRALARPELQSAIGSLQVMSAPHPSQRVYNRPGVRAQEQVHAAFAQAAW